MIKPWGNVSFLIVTFDGRGMIGRDFDGFFVLQYCDESQSQQNSMFDEAPGGGVRRLPDTPYQEWPSPTGPPANFWRAII